MSKEAMPDKIWVHESGEWWSEEDKFYPATIYIRASTCSALQAENAELKEQLNGIVPRRVQPCGCQLCFCADQVQCHGCGAHKCDDPNCNVRKGILEYEKHPTIATLQAENERLQKYCDDLEESLTVRREEVERTERIERVWREVCADFRIEYDDHPIGLQSAIIHWMAQSLRENTALRERVKEAVELMRALMYSVSCQYCGDNGYCMVGDQDDPQQEECEHCRTTPNSVYRAGCNAEAFISHFTQEQP